MTFCELSLKRNRGWPWPEKNFGFNDSLYGSDGWCRECGIPLGPQSGPLILQGKGLKNAQGAWVPNWMFDFFILEDSLATAVAEDFSVNFRDVSWRGQSPAVARQVEPVTVGPNWFQESELATLLLGRHKSVGKACTSCGTWRWSPLDLAQSPGAVVYLPLDAHEHDVIVSPEWFGAGWNCYRQILFRQELAHRIAEASPRDFVVHTPVQI